MGLKVGVTMQRDGSQVWSQRVKAAFKGQKEVAHRKRCGHWVKGGATKQRNMTQSKNKGWSHRDKQNNNLLV